MYWILEAKDSVHAWRGKIWTEATKNGRNEDSGSLLPGEILDSRGEVFKERRIAKREGARLQRERGLSWLFWVSERVQRVIL